MDEPLDMQTRLLVVSPVFNEASHFERVARAIERQIRRPDLWVVVDDGSTDGTLELLKRLEAEIPFMRVIEHRPVADAGSDRLAVALEARAFNAGLRSAGGPARYTHIGKLDGDIELPPDWFSTLLGAFDSDPTLGVACGALLEPQEDGSLKRLRYPGYHVPGAIKLYSRVGYETSGGVREQLGWDTIDDTYARMRGLATRSFDAPVAMHLRPSASADGQLRGRARHGECAWIVHYGLGWVALRSLKVALDRPYVFSGVWFLGGYLRARLRRVPQVPDRAFRTFARHELRARLRRSAAAVLSPRST